MRLPRVLPIGVMAVLAVAQAGAQDTPFLGAWNLSGDAPRVLREGKGSLAPFAVERV